MTFLSALTTHRWICTCVLTLGAIAPASQAFAQRSTLLATIPFPFQEGHHSFPAGEYIFQATSEHVLQIRNRHSDQLGLVMTLGELSAQPPRSAKVVFRKYGDQYFLSDVWLANSTTGRQLVMSQAEKQLRGTPGKRPATGNQIALNITQP